MSPSRAPCVTHFQDWNTRELLASVVAGKGEFVQLLGTFAEVTP